VLFVSVAFDVGATPPPTSSWPATGSAAWASAGQVSSVWFVFAPSIISFGWGLDLRPSYVATVGIWAVGVDAANTVIGMVAFGDPFGARTALGGVVARITVFLLKPV
jgi:hypothetical protein